MDKKKMRETLEKMKQHIRELEKLVSPGDDLSRSGFLKQLELELGEKGARND